MNVDLLNTDVTLLVGALFFALGAGAPDFTGLTRQVRSDPVPVVGKDPTGWRWANNAFSASGILTFLGLGLLALLLIEDGSRILAPAGLLLLGLATVFWLTFPAFRERVTAWAGLHYLEESSEPAVYEPLSTWGGEMVKLNMLLG